MTLLTIAILTSANAALSEKTGNLIDDFNDAKLNSLGVARHFVSDTTAGGETSAEYSINDGILLSQGEIIPPRGQPGWASAILLLNTDGTPVDLSQFKGIRILIRVNEGNLSLSANSSEITNFDYHAAMITPRRDGKFHVIKIPFDSMKRTWSAQTPLNTSTIMSLSLVSFNMQRGSFDYEVDEVSFY